MNNIVLWRGAWTYTYIRKKYCVSKKCNSLMQIHDLFLHRRKIWHTTASYGPKLAKAPEYRPSCFVYHLYPSMFIWIKCLRSRLLHKKYWAFINLSEAAVLKRLHFFYTLYQNLRRRLRRWHQHIIEYFLCERKYWVMIFRQNTSGFWGGTWLRVDILTCSLQKELQQW